MSDNQVRYCQECKQRKSGWSTWVCWVCEECFNKALEEMCRFMNESEEKEQNNEQ